MNKVLLDFNHLSSLAYRNVEMTREGISFTFDPRDMLLSLQVGFSFVRAAMAWAVLERPLVVYFWGFYDIKFKLTQYKSKLGLIPQYTFDLRESEITNLKFGSNTTIYLAQHVTLTNYKPKPGLIPQHTKQTSLY